MNTASHLSPALPVPERTDKRIFERNRIGSPSRELGPTMAEVFARIRGNAPRPQLPRLLGPAQSQLLLAAPPLPADPPLPEDPAPIEKGKPLNLFEEALARFEALQDPDAIAIALREIIVQAEVLSPRPAPPRRQYPRFGWSALMPALAITACALGLAQLASLSLASILRPDLRVLVPWGALLLAVPAGLTLVSAYCRWRLAAAGLLHVGRNWHAGDVRAQVIAAGAFRAILEVKGEGRQAFPYHLAIFYPVTAVDPGDCSKREFGVD